MRISDWSSDVCSSDLPEIEFLALEARAITLEAANDPGAIAAYLAAIGLLESVRGRLALGDLRMGVADRRLAAIGSASCRERVCQYVSISGVAVSLKTKTKL